MEPTDHLSDFALDQLVISGAGTDHLKQCAECQRRFSAIQAQASRSLANPEFLRVGRAVIVPQATRRRKNLWVPIATLVAAMLLIIFSRPLWSGPTERMKGASRIELVRSNRAAPDEALRVGERLTLRLEGEGEAAVFSVNEGVVEQVWPTGAASSAEVPSGGRLVELEVTSGALRLVATFFTSRESTVATRAALQKHVSEGVALSSLRGVGTAYRVVTEERSVITP